jgi:predicted CXXCH cytochrome family protein
MEGGGTELCVVCHDDVASAAAAAAVPHAALEVAGCSDCHSPHASAQPHLIRFASGGECTMCHDEQVAREEETAHGVITSIGCRACHEPHGGTEPGLLRQSGSELCLACHDPRAVKPPPGAESVRVLDGLELPAELAARMPTVALAANGQSGHPVQGHRTLGIPTEAELRNTDSTFWGELTCLTCHDPHKGRGTQLLRWNATSGPEACAHCHREK